jgi:hypothetical protein
MISVASFSEVADARLWWINGPFIYTLLLLMQVPVSCGFLPVGFDPPLFHAASGPASHAGLPIEFPIGFAHTGPTRARGSTLGSPLAAIWTWPYAARIDVDLGLEALPVNPKLESDFCSRARVFAFA